MKHADLYRQIIHSFTDGVVALNLDGTIRFANAAAEELLGAHDLEGRRIDAFLDDEGAEHSVRHLDRAAMGEFVGDEVDSMFVRADGTARWVRLKQTGLLDAGGQVEGVILRLTDNHESKQLIDEISRSREDLMAAEQIARLGSWSWHRGHPEVAYSQGMVELYGDQVTKVAGSNQDDLLAVTHPEDRERLVRHLDGMTDGSIPVVDLELRQLGRHGWMWVQLRALATYDEDGQAISTSGTYQDITRARDSEDQLQGLVTQNTMLQEIASAANEATTLDDVLSQVLQLVPSYDAWERGRAFVPDDSGTGLVPHQSSAGQVVDQSWPEVVETELATALECLRTGVPCWDPRTHLTIAFPIEVDGDVLAVVTLTARRQQPHADIVEAMVQQGALQLARVAEREQAAQLVADARDRAVDASRHKSEFLATMSHEIRTPLNGVIGLNELLGRTALTEDQKHLVSGIAVSGRSLLEVINDILDFSKIEAGRLELEAVDFDLRGVMEQAIGLLSESARVKGVELRVSCHLDVPAQVNGDPVRFQQVLTNLVSNAIKFTTEGVVAVRATCEVAPPGSSGGASTVRVEVQDTGVGIEPEQQQHIFAPFMQADASTTRRFGGTGLGLAICSEIVEAWDGQIGLESTPGEGSTFWFTASLRGPVGEAVGEDLREVRSALGGSRVLVIDADTESRVVLREYLTWWDVGSDGVTDPDRGVSMLVGAAADGSPYSAVVLDLGTSESWEVDVLMFAIGVRSEPELLDLPVVLLTPAPPSPDSRLHQAGVTAALAKPLQPTALRDVLMHVMTAPEATHEQGDPTRARPRAGSAEDRSFASPTAQGLVLVAEDNPVNQVVARGLLEGLGYRVDLAENGAEALEMVGSHDYDAVLMDLQMPVLDGYAATRALRTREQAEGSGRRLPVLAMTAAAISGERERCLEAGMDDFITKPVATATLGAVLRRWVDTPESPESAGRNPDRLEAGSEGPPRIQGLDLVRIEQLRLLFHTDSGYLDRAIDGFVDSVPQLRTDVREAVAEQSAKGLADVAHSLKGGARTIGLVTVAELAADLELLGRSGRLDVTGRLDALDLALDAAVVALGTYRTWVRALVS